MTRGDAEETENTESYIRVEWRCTGAPLLSTHNQKIFDGPVESAFSRKLNP